MFSFHPHSHSTKQSIISFLYSQACLHQFPSIPSATHKNIPPNHLSFHNHQRGIFWVLVLFNNSINHTLWMMWKQKLDSCEELHQKQYKDECIDEGGWMWWWSSVYDVFWYLWTNPSFNIQCKYHHLHFILGGVFKPPPKCVESHSSK